MAAAAAAAMSHLAGVLPDSAVRQAVRPFVLLGERLQPRAERFEPLLDVVDSVVLAVFRAVFSRLSAAASSSRPSTEASRSCSSDGLPKNASSSAWERNGRYSCRSVSQPRAGHRDPLLSRALQPGG